MLVKLLNEFSRVDKLPVEISEVRDAIVRIGIQDKIIFCPDDQMDPADLRGAYYQYTHRPILYGDPERVSLIVYCSKLDLPWQRLVCCKEMIHILDAEPEKTDVLEDLDGLLGRLLGPMSTEDFGICDIMAARDRIAIYQALPLLFPMAARANALSKQIPAETIADKADLPLPLVRLVLEDDWPSILQDLTC